MVVRVALIGDHNPEIPAHRAIPVALERAARVVGCAVEPDWIGTDRPSIVRDLENYDAIWCVPGSPYLSMDGALNGIRWARETNTPFLGTCGGFQHAIIEYARNVLGLVNADHAESNPTAGTAIIAPLVCPLVGVAGSIHLIEGTRLQKIYGSREAREEYFCRYGLDPDYRARLAGLSVSAIGENAEVRAVELPAHPFFLATLFQPERWALSGPAAHPLVTAFVAAMAS